MGRSVKSVNGKKPSKYMMVPCPHCGHTVKTLNGLYLKYLRESKGIDQRALGELISVSGPYVSDLERNRRICPDNILAIYEAL